MAKLTILNNQNAIDATVLAYGNQEAYFRLHLENEALIIDDSPARPEITIPAVFAVGQDIEFDETNALYDTHVIKTLRKAAGVLAAGVSDV